LKRRWIIMVNLMLVSLPVLSWAGGGGEKADKLIRKVDLTTLTGLNYIFAKWYNDNLWLYAIIVTLLMGVIGLIIAVVTDIILKMIGMEVSKIEHHE
jgi:ABC-type phosphate/phosphonate transport system permease subunit